MFGRFSPLVARAALVLIVVCAFQAPQICAQESAPLASINYQLTMSRPASHLFEVKIEARLPEGATTEHLDFQMPRWSPGRYAVFDFAKNVVGFQAASGICPPTAQCKLAPLSASRIDNQTWRVTLGGAKNLTVRYKVFGDDLSGTFSQLDERHANFNGGSIFMYIVGHKQDPVSLEIEPPAGWRITNGRTERADQRTWQFPNYDLLIDTPTEIAPDWTMEEFKVDGKTYRVVVHSFGEEGGKRKQLVRDIEKIVRAETRMWGAPEFESYTFIIHFAADDRSGDGMEHLNSTQIIEPGALSEPGVLESARDTAAHEFFHVWNVKRLRPVELGPWDFTRPLATRSLWIAEGITNYYGHLMTRRARLWTDAELLQKLGQQIRGIENAPGSALTSAEESSIIAPLIDGALSAQRNDLGNTAVSYYPKGEVVGLVLDLLIRGKTNGRKSLDDVMREMYRRFYLESAKETYYLRGRGYRPEDFERVATEVAGFDLHEFFERYVRRPETLPYNEAFAAVGLRLVRTPSAEPFNGGISIDFDVESGVKIASVRHDSPAELAGLSQGDIILSIGGTPVTPDNWRAVLNRYKQGERVPVSLRRDRRMIQTTLTLGPPESFDYRIEEREDAIREMRARREAWMNG